MKQKKKGCVGRLMQLFRPENGGNNSLGMENVSSFRLSEKRFFPVVNVEENQFVRNSACCLVLGRSVRNSSLVISKNNFFRNLSNIKCYLLKNKRPLEISRNTFQIPVNQRNKTIKISKRFSNLKLNDNEFVVVEADPEDERMINEYFSWAQKSHSRTVSLEREN